MINSASFLEVSLGQDQEIALGETINLQASTSIPANSLDTIIWQATNGILSCENCIEQELTPLSNTTYSIQVIDQNGCVATSEVNIIVLKEEGLYIPNSFSPNGDGVNDVFQIFADDGVAEINELQIFDRWGNQVFQKKSFPPNDFTFGWDGDFRGEAMNPGVFVYWVEVMFLDGRTKLFHGDITLVK